MPSRLSCAVGAVVLSGWMTVFALLGIAWRPVVLVLMAMLVSYLLRLLLPSSEAAQEEVPARESRTSLAEKLALVVIVISVLAALAAAASASATSPDLLLFWGPTALISAPRKSRLVLLPLAVSAVLAAFFVFIYLHGEINPGKWIEWSAGRVFSPIAALLVLASVCRRTAQS